MYLSTLKQRTGIGNYAYNLMKALSEIVAVKNDDKLYSYAHGKLFQNLDIENTSSNNIINLILKFLPSKYLYAIPFYGTFNKIFEVKDYTKVLNFDSCIKYFLEKNKRRVHFKKILPNIIIF